MQHDWRWILIDNRWVMCFREHLVLEPHPDNTKDAFAIFNLQNLDVDYIWGPVCREPESIV